MGQPCCVMNGCDTLTKKPASACYRAGWRWVVADTTGRQLAGIRMVQKGRLGARSGKRKPAPVGNPGGLEVGMEMPCASRQTVAGTVPGAIGHWSRLPEM